MQRGNVKRAARRAPAWIAGAALVATTVLVGSCNDDNHPPLAACPSVAALDAAADAMLPDGAIVKVTDAAITCIGPTGINGGPGAPPGNGTGATGNFGGAIGGGAVGNGGLFGNGGSGAGVAGSGFGGAGLGATTGAGGATGVGFGGVTGVGATGTGTGLGTGATGTGLGTGATGTGVGTGIPGGTLPGVGASGF